MIESRIDTTAFRAWLKNAGEKLQANARQALGQSVAVAHQHARATQSFKDRSGALRNSIVRFQQSTWHMGIKATAPHALYVEEGTKDSPNRIIARGQALRFVWHGQVMFLKSVAHKGMKPRHFMRDAQEAGERALNETLERAINNAFR